MRWIIVWFAVWIAVFPQSSSVQAQPLVRAIARHMPLPTYDTVDYTLQCPAGYIPNGYSATPQYPYDVNEDQFRLFIDPKGATINKATLATGAQMDGGGYSLEVYNTEHHDKNLEALATCLAVAASSDGTFQIAKASATVAKFSQGTVKAFCPADYPVAFGGFSSADSVLLLDYGGSPLWGTSAAPILLSSLANGTTMGPPTGWLSRVYNITTTDPVVAYAVCGKAPALQSYIYAVSAPGAVFGVPTAFSIYAPVPQGWAAVASGFDGGDAGSYLSTDVWMDDGIVVSAQQWFTDTSGYDSGTANVRAYTVYGSGSLSGGPAAVAVLALPQSSPPPAPRILTAVEYYNASLDHYFVTAIPDEITKLDNGTFVGWARTGESFDVYDVRSGGGNARHPVCREYGVPLYGLDTHFYSASIDECAATLQKGVGSWLLESSDVFEMDLPDTNGNCPAGEIPVYRIWNQRKDSNHRYTTKTSIRDQMVAKGGVAEGYGPNAVALCGAP